VRVIAWKVLRFREPVSAWLASTLAHPVPKYQVDPADYTGSSELTDVRTQVAKPENDARTRFCVRLFRFQGAVDAEAPGMRSEPLMPPTSPRSKNCRWGEKSRYPTRR